MQNLEEYIASGAIEACLLGIATPEEVAEMERLAAAHPRVATEVDAVRTSLDALHLAAGTGLMMSPPPALKGKVLAAVQAESSSKPSTKGPAATAEKPAVSAPRSGRQWLPWTLALLSVAAALSFALAWYNAADTANKNLQKAESWEQRTAVMKRNYEIANQKLALAEHQRDSIWMACASMVELKGLPLAPAARAYVYYHPGSGEVMAEVAMLPAPPTGKEYQLWAIVDGQPVDLGMLHMQGEKMPAASMKKVMEAQAFAVTLEDAGGSAVPTMDQMYVLGNT